MARELVTSIEIGSRWIRLLQVRRVSGEILVEKAVSEELILSETETADPGARQEKIVRIIQEMFKATKIKPVNVVLVIPGRFANLRLINLPLMEEKSLHEALKLGGLSDYIPFDLKQMVWDAQIIKQYRRKEEVPKLPNMDVLLGVVRKEPMEGYMSICDKTKLSPKIVDVSSLALANFICFNSEQKEDNAGQMLVDMGAKSTNISVMEGCNVKFNLDIQIGGDDLTDVLSAGLAISRTQAEEIKRKMDFETFKPETDNQSSREMNAIAPKFKELLRQLSGALTFYSSRPDSKPIEEIILAGGGANLINISNLIMRTLEKKTAKPTLNFQKFSLRRLKAEEASVLSENLPMWCTVLGAALNGCVEVVHKLNLLPEEVILTKKLVFQRIITAAVAGVAVIGLAFGTFAKISRIKRLESNEEIISRKIGGASTQTMDLLRKDSELKHFEDVKSFFSKTLNSIPASQSLIELYRITPVDMTFDLYDMKSDNNLKISGTVSAGKDKQLQEFLTKCQDSKYYQNIMLKNTNFTENWVSFSFGRRAGEKK